MDEKLEISSKIILFFLAYGYVMLCYAILFFFTLRKSSLQNAVSQVLVFFHSQPKKVERSVAIFVLPYGFVLKFFHCTSIFFSFFP